VKKNILLISPSFIIVEISLNLPNREFVYLNCYRYKVLIKSTAGKSSVPGKAVRKTQKFSEFRPGRNRTIIIFIETVIFYFQLDTFCTGLSSSYFLVMCSRCCSWRFFFFTNSDCKTNPPFTNQFRAIGFRAQ